jgi:hypothetical protein
MGKLPGDDEAILEGYAASLAAHQKVSFERAKEDLINQYSKNIKKSTKGGKVDQYKFQEEMYNYINKNAIPK